jgi:hypothetical protein
MLTITYFYDTVPLDVDNMLKPIMDALTGLVYMDDSQITDVLCRKRDLNSNLRIENPSNILAEGFIQDREPREFLHILAQAAPDQEVIR